MPVYVPEQVPRPAAYLNPPEWTVGSGLGEGNWFGAERRRRHAPLRRAKAMEIYRKTDNLCAVQLLLGHTKVDSTVRYLGVELEDALCIAEQIAI